MLYWDLGKVCSEKHLMWLLISKSCLVKWVWSVLLCCSVFLKLLAPLLAFAIPSWRSISLVHRWISSNLNCALSGATLWTVCPNNKCCSYYRHTPNRASLLTRLCCLQTKQPSRKNPHVTRFVTLMLVDFMYGHQFFSVASVRKKNF